MSDIADVRAALRAVADPALALGMQAYMKDHFPFLGIRTERRRHATQDLIRARGTTPDWPWINALWEEPEREYQYVAADHLQKAQISHMDLPNLRRIITTKSWWDTVDMLPRPIGRFADAEGMLTWSRDENLWVRRVAILHQLGKKDAVDADLLAEIIRRNLGSQEFFINKAIGWALRDYARTQPEWVLDFAETTELSALSRREALKHLR